MTQNVSGILKIDKNGGTLRDPARSFKSSPQDCSVSTSLIREFCLVEGAMISGLAERGKRGMELLGIEHVCGLSPEAFKNRKPFSQLTAIDPTERFRLGQSPEVAMRIVDLVAPIGKGTRGLIVSPPKAGKTTILEQIATAIRLADANARIIVMLIDERPEEVTHLRRSLNAEVLASSNDQEVREHVELAELTLAHVRTELECGKDVVLMVDSLTRMGRAFNIKGSGTRRMMSGGIEAGSLDIPRKFFGLARNIEGGGSVTIIATALVDTGSKMDQLIFEEFKGTGNSELMLDRSLAEARLFPAIDIPASGTRKEERLYDPEEFKKIEVIRKALGSRKPKDALTGLLQLVQKNPTNDTILKSPAKA